MIYTKKKRVSVLSSKSQKPKKGLLGIFHSNYTNKKYTKINKYYYYSQILQHVLVLDYTKNSQ